MFQKGGFLLFVVLILSSGCRKDTHEVVSIVKDKYTISEQETFGRELDAYFEKNLSILPTEGNEQAYEYLWSMVKMVVKTPTVELRDSLDWNVKLINEEGRYQIFVSPSGSIYMTTGLLKKLNAENQLVALVAHQVYYVESGKAFDLVKNSSDKIEFGKVVLGEPSDEIGTMASLLLIKPYSEDVVRDADDFQVNLLCPFKYDSSGMIDVFSKDEIVECLNKTTPWDNIRKAHIALISNQCGANDSLFIDRYQEFLRYLN